jgi:hypothetical protein
MRAIRYTHAAGAAALLLVASIATAAPVTLNFQGRVAGYTALANLMSAYFPVGDSVSLSLTFNETFSDGTYSFADDLGPVTGAMTVGSSSFAFDGVTPYSYQYADFAGQQVAWVTPYFTGTGPTFTGPTFGTGTLFGLFMSIATDLTLVGDLQLGYAFTPVVADGSATYGYAKLTPDSYSITPASVPEPSTFALLALGSVLALARRRRRTSPALH